MPLAVQPTMQELTDAIRSLANGKTVGPDRVSVELFKITLNGDPVRYRRSYFEGGRGAAVVERCHHHGTLQKEGSDRVRQLQEHLAGSARRQDTAEDHRSPPQRVLRSRGDPAGGTEWSPTEPFNHRYYVVIRRLQELARKKRILLSVCFIDLTKAYDSVDRTLLWTALVRFGVPQNMISAIRRLHDGMRACVRPDDRVCSKWFAMKQDLRQGCVLAPLLFNIFFAAVINVASTRFNADEGNIDALVHLRKKRGAGRRREANAGESVFATPLWGMLYADNAGVVSQSPEQLRKMMEVIMIVCAAFSLTVSEANTEIMCLRAKGTPESTAIFSVEAGGQVYDQTNEFVYLGGNVNHNTDLYIEVDRRIRNA